MLSMLPGRKKKNRLVLDIGASAIRCCELVQTRNGYQLTKYVQKEFNADPSLEENTRSQLKQKALEEALKEIRIRTRKTIFGVPGQSVFTRHRTLPPVPEYKVTQIVRYEIQQQIPFSLDQLAMDYQILNRTEAGGYEVMMAAIKSEVVDRHLEILKNVRRSIDIVDVCPLAAYNWLKNTGEYDEGECVAFIDMGAATTDIVIERENQFRFTRPLNIGGNDITKAIAEAFAMNFIDAEKLKRERGFAPAGDPKRDGKGGEVIGSVLERLVSEIMRSFGYFRSLPGGGQVNRVVLSGGCAGMRNIVPYLQRQLGIDVRIAQPLSGVAIAPNAQQVSDAPEQACVVLGLALRTCGTAPIEINLIPPRVLEAARRREQAFYWALALIACGLIMASIIPDSANENKIVREHIDLLKSYIRQYDPEVAQLIRPGTTVPVSMYKQQLDTAKRQINRLQEEVAYLDGLREDRRFWLDELSFVNETRPASAGFWFSCIESGIIREEEAEDRPGGRSAPGRRARPGMGPGGPGRDTSGGGDEPFPGIGSQRPIGGRDGGMRQSGQARGRGRNAGQNNEAAVKPANGLIIRGFAETDQIIRDYVNALRATEKTLPDGKLLRGDLVKFDETSVRRYPMNILYEAPVDGRFTGAGQRSDDMTAWNPQVENSIFSFTVRVRFFKDFPDAGQQDQPTGEGVQ
jgi:type IV pilus assembly protein PilM